MTIYVLVGVALWLGFNAAFVCLRLRAAETRRYDGLEELRHYNFRV